MNLKTFLLLALAVYTLSCRSTRMSIAPGATSGQSTDSTWNAAFESKIEALRLRYHIPGLSAGVVYQGKLVWKKGFGYADVDRQVVPDEHTVYQIASLTKTFGSIILMQQVEAGRISLDDPIQKYGISLGGRWSSDTSIKIKHLLTHTAMGTTWNGFKPGYSFRHNGDWYGQLGKAIEKASGQTLPIRRFKYGFSPAAGIMSCVSDLAYRLVDGLCCIAGQDAAETPDLHRPREFPGPEPPVLPHSPAHPRVRFLQTVS